MASWPQSSSLAKSSAGVAANSRHRVRQRAHGHAVRAARHSADLLEVCGGVESRRGRPPGSTAGPDRVSESRGTGLAGESAAIGRVGMWPSSSMAQHDVLVPVVILGTRTDLGPLPSEEGDHVRVAATRPDGVALTNRLDGLAPAARRRANGMVVDGPEVEPGAQACEVTGVRNRVCTVAARERERGHIGVRREAGVDVEISE